MSINPNISGNFGEYVVILNEYKIYQKYIQYEKTKSALNAAIYIIHIRKNDNMINIQKYSATTLDNLSWRFAYIYSRQYKF